VAASLAWLRERGVPLALVTGKSRPTALMSLKQFGLDGLFEPVETGSPSGVVKAAAIARVVAGWRAARARVIYVGDAHQRHGGGPRGGRAADRRRVGAAASAAELRALAAARAFTDAGDFHAWLAGS